ncbi:MAG TPA: helix-turn-helix domain-containing protein [Solirubrobacteraceae bacterium]|jgi:DNA-binding HxlR family transcriptional regulator|nr:helix-turn-helix domain-containing protein [Solirubrobacteraceae bacterium]
MLGNRYESQDCSIARALEIVGERWTLLVVRDALLGVRRFDDFQRSLGVARNVLQARLERLVESGILERRVYQERPRRHEYVPTGKGLELWPVIVHLLRWGDRHLAPDGAPAVFEHRDCGGSVDERLRCDRCGEPLDSGSVRLRRLRSMPAPAND